MSSSTQLCYYSFFIFCLRFALKSRDYIRGGVEQLSATWLRWFFGGKLLKHLQRWVELHANVLWYLSSFVITNKPGDFQRQLNDSPFTHFAFHLIVFEDDWPRLGYGLNWQCYLSSRELKPPAAILRCQTWSLTWIDLIYLLYLHVVFCLYGEIDNIYGMRLYQ